MNYNKKLTVADLIARKSEREKNNSVLVNVPGLGGEVECKKLGLDRILSMMDRYDATEASQSIAFQRELILAACPLFKDEALQDAYNVAEPIDIVDAVLDGNFADYNVLTDAILAMNGFAEAKAEIKN